MLAGNEGEKPRTEHWHGSLVLSIRVEIVDLLPEFENETVTATKSRVTSRQGRPQHDPATR